MGIGTRVFIIDDDDSIHRIATALYDRLLHRDPGECIPAYSGKSIRCATVILEVAGRMPLSVIETYYSILYFDSEGRLDSDMLDKAMLLAAGSMKPVFEEQWPSNIIDSQWKFARKSYANRFKWTPSPKMEASIMAAIFGDI